MGSLTIEDAAVLHAGTPCPRPIRRLHHARYFVGTLPICQRKCAVSFIICTCLKTCIAGRSLVVRCMSKSQERTLLSCFREHCCESLVLHSDNGAPMKSQTMRAKAYELGITTSYNRPRVSNDNPFAESLFRTCKYRPDWPSSGFKTLNEARAWVLKFTRWYNEEHKHSKLRFVTPNQRHNGEDEVILMARQKCLAQARKNNPNRWGSRELRNCVPVGPTTLNPDKREKDIQQKQAA